MILTGSEIISEWYAGRIAINPFDPRAVGPNSIDVRLSPRLERVLPSRTGQLTLDVKRPMLTEPIDLDADAGFVLKPGDFYLGSTVESAGSDYYVPMYEGRSTMARYGIQSHMTAGFGDIGFKGAWTLEISVRHPVHVYPHMRIGQIYFIQPKGQISLYKGSYAGAVCAKRAVPGNI